jgi:hypothetical protein
LLLIGRWKNSKETKKNILCFSHQPIRSRVALLLFTVFWCKKPFQTTKYVFESTFGYFKDSEMLKNCADKLYGPFKLMLGPYHFSSYSQKNAIAQMCPQSVFCFFQCEPFFIIFKTNKFAKRIFLFLRG